MTADLREELQQTLGAAYTLERELGSGGMSRVFVAQERALGRTVVVKVLPPDLAGAVSAGRFRREIALAAKLQHPHIVPLLAAGEVPAGHPDPEHGEGEGPRILYYTMPLVEGESLRAKLVRDGELPVAEAVSILREIARALAYAHAHGVVHRDVKPDNVLLCGGAAMVTDFGVARALAASFAPESLTRSEGMHSTTSIGVALGTPAYMAPEQAAADPQVDHRADLYALGCVAYELLTGRAPFAGRAAQQTLAAQVTEAPQRVDRLRPGVPPALAALVMRLLEKRPADRPQSANEVLRALDAVTTSGAEPAVGSRAASRGRRAWMLVLVGAAIVLAIAVIAVVVSARRARGDVRTGVGGSAAAALDPKRVAVAAFQDRTSDPAFEALIRPRE